MDIFETIKDKIVALIKDQFIRNYGSGSPKIPPHVHNGIDNLQIPYTNITGTPASASAAGVNGDIQINASGVFGTVGGMNVDQTGNTRGTNALDIQSFRTAVTQVASGKQSMAIGNKATASGDYSTASGYYQTASGYGAVAFGGFNHATNTNSIAAGYNNSSSAVYSSAIGYGNDVRGNNSSGIGNTNFVQGTDDLAVGFGNTTSNYGSEIAVGISNHTTNGALAFGVNNTVSGKLAVSLGWQLGTNATDKSLLIGSWTSQATMLMDGVGNTTFNNATTGTFAINTASLSGGSGNINVTTGNISSGGTAGSITLKTGDRPGGLAFSGGKINLNSGRGTIVKLSSSDGLMLGDLIVYSGTLPVLGGLGYTGVGALAIGNTSGSPGAVTNGGVFYVNAGALHWLGSSGTDTTIAPA